MTSLHINGKAGDCRSFFIKNGKIIDPSTSTEAVLDIEVKDGVITRVGKDLSDSETNVYDASGKIIFPGFIDMHVHLRDPGLTYKEDIATGGAAAAAGGFTTVCAMPNTSPVTDSSEIVSYIVNKAKTESPVRVLPIAAVTKGMEGRELVDFKSVIDAGACAISEDGKSVMNARLLRDAMITAREMGFPVLSHCEDLNLAGGVVNAGPAAERLSLPGIDENIEDIIAIRDILLAKETGAHIHLCHNSTANSYKFIQFAKEQGVSISAEVTPHHFTLTDEDIPSADASEYKMSPPLRSPATVEVLIKGLTDGTYNVIATDHAPHSPEDKSGGFLKGANGIVGLETAVSLTYTKLVKQGHLSLMQMASYLSYNPAQILGLPQGRFSAGAPADITIFDPEASYTVKASDLHSKSRNMPYEGMNLTGRITATICAGRFVYEL